VREPNADPIGMLPAQFARSRHKVTGGRRSIKPWPALSIDWMKEEDMSWHRLSRSNVSKDKSRGVYRWVAVNRLLGESMDVLCEGRVGGRFCG
jgi:hypothetical protein